MNNIKHHEKINTHTQTAKNNAIQRSGLLFFFLKRQYVRPCKLIRPCLENHSNCFHERVQLFIKVNKVVLFYDFVFYALSVSHLSVKRKLCPIINKQRNVTSNSLTMPTTNLESCNDPKCKLPKFQ